MVVVVVVPDGDVDEVAAVVPIEDGSRRRDGLGIDGDDESSKRQHLVVVGKPLWKNVVVVSY